MNSGRETPCSSLTTSSYSMHFHECIQVDDSEWSGGGQSQFPMASWLGGGQSGCVTASYRKWSAWAPSRGANGGGDLRLLPLTSVWKHTEASNAKLEERHGRLRVVRLQAHLVRDDSRGHKDASCRCAHTLSLEVLRYRYRYTSRPLTYTTVWVTRYCLRGLLKPSIFLTPFFSFLL